MAKSRANNYDAFVQHWNDQPWASSGQGCALFSYVWCDIILRSSCISDEP